MEYECGGALDGFRRCGCCEVCCLEVCEGVYDSPYVDFCECDGGVFVLYPFEIRSIVFVGLVLMVGAFTGKEMAGNIS